ncbi:MAG: methyl-accepting chemotaxis protein, partial [Chitinophagaceae bacterium]
MSLSSKVMQLSSSEKNWLPWFGKTGKIAMGWSCRLNRSAYPVIEQTFEAIAQTRVQLLHNWTREQWEHLAELAETLGRDIAHTDRRALMDKLSQAEDFSELFVVGVDGKVITSTWSGR